MSLRGQGSPSPRRGFGGTEGSPRRGFGGTGGYAMAALLVALAVMAVLMSVALPVWRHDAQREVKAVTHHGARVERDGSGYRATLIFDV